MTRVVEAAAVAFRQHPEEEVVAVAAEVVAGSRRQVPSARSREQHCRLTIMTDQE